MKPNYFKFFMENLNDNLNCLNMSLTYFEGKYTINLVKVTWPIATNRKKT